MRASNHICANAVSLTESQEGSVLDTRRTIRREINNKLMFPDDCSQGKLGEGGDIRHIIRRGVVWSH